MKRGRKEEGKRKPFWRVWKCPPLESLNHIGKSVNFVLLVMVEDTFGADRLLVCVAVSVDFLVGMLFAVHN